MRYGILSLTASQHLFGNKDHEGVHVKYEPHPRWMGAVKVWRESDGVYIGGYVSVGPDGIIDTEGKR